MNRENPQFSNVAAESNLNSKDDSHIAWIGFKCALNG